MTSFFDKVANAKPHNPDRAERYLLSWIEETSGQFDGYWNGLTHDNVVVAVLRPTKGSPLFTAFYVGFGNILERPDPVSIQEAKTWAQERHSEALAAQVETMLQDPKL